MRDIRPASGKPEPRAGHGVRICYGIMGVPSQTNRFRSFKLTICLIFNLKPDRKTLVLFEKKGNQYGILSNKRTFQGSYQQIFQKY